MASITIRELDDTTKERLRVRAAHHKRLMEEEVRSILRAALAADEAPSGRPITHFDAQIAAIAAVHGATSQPVTSATSTAVGLR